MYRIIGQPINIRRVYKIGINESELTEQAQKIIKIVEFGLNYGYKAAIEAFELSKSSYYNYVKLYKACQDNGCIIEIKSKRPHNIRKANWDSRIVKFICKMRKDHPNIGKYKIKPHLDKYCQIKGIKPISSGTIQNIINSFPNKLRTKKSLIRAKRRENVLRKPSNYKARASGECISLDSMEFRRDGKKLYVVVVQDEATNLMYARATNSHASRSTTEILETAYHYLPYSKFTTILTDNGSEFQ
ncbi:MAG: DDE-type integrase/transposase/recombinase, partial [Neisseriaceae bacterium]